jgi:hypothetical protein
MTLEILDPVSGRRIAPVYVLLDHEMLLDAPIADAWPHIVNYPSWQNYSSVERISGQQGCVGEVVALRKEEKGFAFPPYYARTLRIDAPTRIVWKTFLAQGAHEIDRFGIVDFRLIDLGERTRFCSHLVYEFLVPYRDECEVSAFQRQQEENFKALHAATRPKLQALIEKRRER